MSELSENIYNDVFENISYTCTPENEEPRTHLTSFIYINYTDSSLTEKNIWNDSLAKITEDCLNSSIESVFQSIKNLSINSNNDTSISIVNDAKSAFDRYVEDNLANKLNNFAIPSEKSLFQLSRFIPELQNLYSSVYIDEESGCFGVILKAKKRSKPILNLLMKSDKEITFSFIKKEKGFIKISGRAYFNEHLDDSKEINNLLRMLKS